MLPELSTKSKLSLNVLLNRLTKARPRLSGTTKARASKRLTDKKLYTGVHAHGGPSTIDKHQGLDDLLDRSAADVRGVKLSQKEQ
ncbi:MAG: hypothetical protein MHM6MM_007179 [Cercozoa sp. M6MM]